MIPLLRVNRKSLITAAVGLVAGCGATGAYLQLSGRPLNTVSADGVIKTPASDANNPNNVIQNHYHFNDQQSYTTAGNLMTSSNGYKWDPNWDKRDPKSLVEKPINSDDLIDDYNEKLEKAKPVATRHLILIRHGQYNQSGETDSLQILTPLGREQADQVGLRLKQLGHPYTRMIQSTMTRATETAEIIGKQLANNNNNDNNIPVDSCDLIREGDPIEPIPCPDNCRSKPKEYFVSGARIESAFRKYFHRSDPQQSADSYDILVCHANVIRYFVLRALQLPPEAWLNFTLNNCSITWITIYPKGQVVVKSVGDIGHMPPNKMSLY
ncbi:serine/threonine-protein phosphatase PGAM5, mitochondrial-like [Oppia nitens]|uniref:serine/threonine-protein phosphatase PGAM5, mitochondrial-like n=1 Tax=Oppia nitens TaxID=1686743 RepID=UPI0023D9F576|nr:serine/threonine-protein phosphatase PGAM5, mitochondrial-like [Oppia nitens]